MKKILSIIFGVLALITLPIWWAMFNILGMRITFKEIFREWLIYWKSGEPWGVFDT